MGLDKRMKKRIQQIDKNLDAIVKNPYEKEHIVEKKENHFPLWAKWAIPFGSVALACSVTFSIILPASARAVQGAAEAGFSEAMNNSADKHVPVQDSNPGKGSGKDDGRGGVPGEILESSEPSRPYADYNMLAPSNVNKYSATTNLAMSQTTYDSYTAFAKKFTTLMMQIGSANGEKSLGISIPDAYLCFAITGIISDQTACNDILSYLELSSVDELKTASSEIISTLGTLSPASNRVNKYVGGYNLNSIWLDPVCSALLRTGADKDQELYDDLADIFDCSLIQDALTEDKANKYLKDHGPNGMPAPEVKLDNDPPAMAVMSAFYYLDLLDESDGYESQYRRSSHFMDYTFGGTTKSVDYLTYEDSEGHLYAGDDFHAAAIDMEQSSVYFYLPDDETAMPSAILQDVLDENYSPVTRTTSTGTEVDWGRVEVNAPYFKMDNQIELKGQPLMDILPNITNDGMGARLVDDSIFLSAIYQFSTMRFDYRGFYSASVTISKGEGAAPGLGPDFTLTVDHPFVFETRRDVMVNANNLTVPVVIGEVVDPAYPAYQAS